MAETEGPKILGKTMASEDGQWVCVFAGLDVSISIWGGNKHSAFIGSTCVKHASVLPDCIAAIERELLAIRAAIPEAKP